MQKFRLMQWCEIATASILFTPDRRAVFEELMAHMEDHRDALMEQGLDEKDATEKALSSMGDAKVIAPQLAAIHRPFWGYALRFSKIALVIVLIIVLLPVWNYLTKVCHFVNPSYYLTFPVYDVDSYGGDTGRTLHHLSEPNVAFSSDGYQFTVTDAAVFSKYSEAQGEEVTQLYFLLDQRCPLPWTETEGYYNTLGLTSACRLLTVTDSLGNFYHSYASRYEDDPALQVVDCQTGLFTATHVCWINDFPKDAEWIEVCYERDGRNLSLKIDLTGGAGE